MKKLIAIFNRTLVVLPFCLAAALAIVYIVGGWGWLFPGYSLEHYSRPKLDNWICSALVLLVMAVIACSHLEMCDRIDALRISRRKKIILTGGALFLIAFAPRFALVFMFRETLAPYSDFNYTWQLANGVFEGNVLEHYSLFPAYLNFAAFETLFAALKKPYVFVLYANVLLSSASTLIIVAIARRIGMDKRTTRLAGLLYALMPANIAYVATGTPEFLTIFFNLLGLDVLLYAFTNVGLKKWAGVLCSGALLGLGASYKSFAIIIIIATAIVLISKLILKREIVGHNAASKRAWGRTLLSITLLFAAYKASGLVVLTATERLYGIELDFSKSLTHFLLVGLNTEGEGQIHLGTLSRQFYKTYEATGCNYDYAKNYALSLLQNDWAMHWQSLPKLFVKKIIWAWQDDVVPVLFLTNSSGIVANSAMEKLTLSFAKKILPSVTELFYFFLMTMAAIGVHINAKSERINFKLEALLLVIFGFFILLLIIEAQSRYKCLIMPFVCIVAALGLGRVKEEAARFCRTHRRHTTA